MLVGFMAAGKSRVGRMLADRLSLNFVDSDAEIEAATRMSVADIFRHLGEPEFRRIERRTIAELVGREPQVISIGGGAFVDPETREILNREATTIWLDPPFEVVWERVSRSNKRPLAAGKSPGELRALWQERREHYEHAHIHIPTSEGPAGQVVEAILEAIASPSGLTP